MLEVVYYAPKSFPQAGGDHTHVHLAKTSYKVPKRGAPNPRISSRAGWYVVLQGPGWISVLVQRVVPAKKVEFLCSFGTLFEKMGAVDKGLGEKQSFFSGTHSSTDVPY